MFYSHGWIVEGSNPTPTHPKLGTYEFPAIKQALADPDYHLIAYHRPKNTDPMQYARKLEADINTLIKHGVTAENITLVGFSRGGEITVLTSTLLKSDKINFALLGTCASELKKQPQYKLYGKVYSVFETTDSVKSCQFLVQRDLTAHSFEEIAITTGRGHGAFYLPREQWICPLKNWIKRN